LDDDRAAGETEIADDRGQLNDSLLKLHDDRIAP